MRITDSILIQSLAKGNCKYLPKWKRFFQKAIPKKLFLKHFLGRDLTEDHKAPTDRRVQVNLSVKIVLELFLQIGEEIEISFYAAGKRLKPKILVREKFNSNLLI